MRVTLSNDGKVVTVELSRRNLIHPTAALDKSSRLVDPYLVRSMDPEEGPVLYVFAQEDHDHYTDREPGPGFQSLVRDRKVAKQIESDGEDV